MATTAARYDLAGLRELARSAGVTGRDVDVAAAVAMAESGGNPKAVSVTNDYGLWQINAPSWPQFTRDQLLTPSGNAAAMAIVRVSGRGWSNWTTYRTGAYQRFMPSSTTATTTATAATLIPTLVPTAEPPSARAVMAACCWLSAIVVLT